VYRNNFNSLGIFLIQNLFIILSPCAFIASIYAILGQFAARIDADDLVPIKPARIAKTFVWSGQYRELNTFVKSRSCPIDVVTFLVQAGGGGLEVSASMAQTGSRVLRLMLSVQIIILTSI
jgi:hypothetical protein